MEDYKSILENADFAKQLKKMEKKYSNKKIVLYGAGEFFRAIQDYYDLSKLNVIAISDKTFIDYENVIYDIELGYNKVSPLHINELKPDIVLISVLKDYFVEKYFCEELFINKKYRFKYDRFFKQKVSTQIMEEFFL